MLGGLLLSHTRPDQFTAEHEALLRGLAAQASVALENARLYEQARARAEELEAVIENMVNGVALHNASGGLVRQNRAARQMAWNASSHSPMRKRSRSQMLSLSL